MTATNNVNGGGSARAGMRGFGNEVWYGTREEIQALGFGVKAEFPDQFDEKHATHTTDDRGDPVTISLFRRDPDGDVYSAMRSFRDWSEAQRERRRQLISDFAPGVTRFKASWWDEYSGDRESLVAAGLVRDGDFPGQPGRGKTRVTFNQDGSLATRGGSKRSEVRWRTTICMVGKNRFRVEVPIDEAENEARLAEYDLFVAEQTRLDDEALEARAAVGSPSRRASHLRLVWSRS